MPAWCCARDTCRELCPELRDSPGCEMFPDTSNTHPGIAQPLFWNGSFGWCLCQRKMQEARSALQCCTSGLYKPRCYPENSTLKPSNSALASTPKQISALTLHQGTDQTADLQTRVFASTLSQIQTVVGKKKHEQIERFLCYLPPAVWTLIMESLYDIELYFSLLLLDCAGAQCGFHTPILACLDILRLEVLHKET